MATIAVYLSGRDGADPVHRVRAAAVGTALARAGHAIVYGGASVGLMGAMADAALAAGGHVTGVIPGLLVDRELAHPGLQQLRVVASMAERKAQMDALADAILILPGGLGTLDEAFETLTGAQLGVHARPVVFLDEDGYYDGLWAWADRAAATGLLAPAHRELLVRRRTMVEALALLEGAGRLA